MHSTIQLFLCIYVLVTSQHEFTIVSNITLIAPTYRHLAAVHNDTLYIIANRTTTVTMESIKLPFNNNSWIEYKNPVDLDLLHSSSSVFIVDQLYVMNTFSTQYPDHTMFAYNLLSNTLLPLSTSPHILTSTCVVYNANNNLIYMIGGMNATAIPYARSNTTQRYNVSTNTWITPGDATNTKRSQAGCSLNSNNSNVYYFGGANGFVTTSNLIERYDVKLDQWYVVDAILQIARKSLKCRLLSLDKRIYCIGGISAGVFAMPSAVVDVFDTEQETVSNINLNIGRTQFTATLWNQDRCIIVCGGYDVNVFLSSRRSVEYLGDCRATETTESTTTSGAPYTPLSSTSADMNMESTLTSEFNSTLETPFLTENEHSIIVTLNTSISITNESSTLSSNVKTSSDSSITLEAPFVTTNNHQDSSGVRDGSNSSIWIIVGIIFIFIAMIMVGVCFYFQRKTMPKVMIELNTDEAVSGDGTKGDVTNTNCNEMTTIGFDMEVMTCAQSTQTSMPKVFEKRAHKNTLEVQFWLENVVRLPQYYEIFINNGYESLMIIKEITNVTELMEIGVRETTDQTRIMQEIKELNIAQNNRNRMVSMEGNAMMMVTQEGE